MRLIGVGDNVCDVYVDKKVMYPGGQALNVAVFASRLGIQAAYLGRFGNDRMGKHVKETLSKIGVHTDKCETHDTTNGFALVTHHQADRVFLGSNRGGPLRERPIVIGPAEQAYLSGFGAIHTSNNSHIDSQLSELANLPGFLSYDFSGAWRDKERFLAVCPHVDLAILSLDQSELGSLDTLARQAHDLGVSMVLFTMGSLGAVLSTGGQTHHQASCHVEAVDTLGAGDSFAAAFLVARLQQQTVQDALGSAARFSAQCCLMEGAFGFGVPVTQEFIKQLDALALPPAHYPLSTDESEE